VGSVRDTAGTLRQLGVLNHRLGNLEAAHRHLEQALTLNREGAHLEGIADTQVVLGQLALESGDTLQAAQLWQASLHLYVHLGTPDAAGVRARLAALERPTELG
jgi:hypothetical protein